MRYIAEIYDKLRGNYYDNLIFTYRDDFSYNSMAIKVIDTNISTTFIYNLGSELQKFLTKEKNTIGLLPSRDKYCVYLSVFSAIELEMTKYFEYIGTSCNEALVFNGVVDLDSETSKEIFSVYNILESNIDDFYFRLNRFDTNVVTIYYLLSTLQLPISISEDYKIISICALVSSAHPNHDDSRFTHFYFRLKHPNALGMVAKAKLLKGVR